MFSSALISVLYSIIMCDGRMLLYNTENESTPSEKYDCIYVFDSVDSGHGGSKMSYCRRQSVTRNMMRVTNKCEHEGEMKYFVDLFKEGIQPSEVLEWNSGIEMADEYAIFYYNNGSMIKLKEKQDFLCRCTHPSTFGKYCEYQLTHEANSFEESQRFQASILHPDSIEHQLFGDIVCYNTLSCTFGTPCLDWRDICNGEQQCENGWDEENCDKLEFNECEENEFRCDNGMCIPEEYWLGGEFISLIKETTRSYIS
jgi:hypothetical protein